MHNTNVEQVVELKFLAINRTFLTVKDIATLMDCSVSKAQKYRTQFFKKYDFDNFFRADVPTSDFLDHYKIDVELIRANYVALNIGGQNRNGTTRI